jgi:valyl-tRNA synthetase
MLQRLAGLEEAAVTLTLEEKPQQALTAVVDDIDIYLPLAGLVDVQQELARLQKEWEKMDSELTRAENKLKNAGFMAKAPDDVVAQERAKAEDYRQRRDKIRVRMDSLA